MLPFLGISLLAAVVVGLCEFAYRQAPAYWAWGGSMILYQVSIGYLFWWLQRHSPNQMVAFVEFTLFLSAARVGLALWAQQPIGAGSWLATAFIGLAALAKLWRP